MIGELVASILIAIVQGLTEWLPVSSSGHLVVVEWLLGFEGGLVFDVALHFGTLMAVFVYFGGDIVDIVKEVLSGRIREGNGRLGILVIVATIPAAFMGYFFRGIFEVAFGSLGIVALGFGVTGIFLIIASLSGKGKIINVGSRSVVRRASGVGARPPVHIGAGRGIIGKVRGMRLSWAAALLIGIAQIFALFPGISRSGATIGAGLLLGLREKDALKFSFLLSIPIIFGANILAIGNQTLPPSLIWATLVSFIVGLGTIHLLYNRILVDRKNLRWFGVYALVLALVLGLYLIL